MLNFKNKHIFNKTRLQLIGALVLILLAVILLWYVNANSIQSTSATAAKVCFNGEYRISDGEWIQIKEGEHIPATKGDVTIRGKFSLMTPDGEPISGFKGTLMLAFYTNHIGLTFSEGGKVTHVIDHENPLFGNSACGVDWNSHYVNFANEEPIEILVKNPHVFGNESAIDEMMESIAIWGNMDFEKGILENGEVQRNVGIFFMIASLVFLGTALFSTLIHIKNSRIIWMMGLVVLFAGMYFAYSADGVSFWSESIVTNTALLGISLMFYMLFLFMIIAYFLKGSKNAALIITAALGLVDAVLIVIPIVSEVFFYDTLLWWVIAQSVANVLMAVCLVKEFISTHDIARLIYAGALLPLISFTADSVMTLVGTASGGLTSNYVFIFLFGAAMVFVLRIIPHSINAAAKANELETEKIALNAQLAESRISTMMSQIRPHFIYNTLGSIEQLCKLDPPKAGDLVHNFAKYLRGNFGELDNPKPILMSQEMEHVHHYIRIENVRFPDMTFTFEMNSSDFKLPALTIQPIVENAIKHGLMKLPKGGTIHVVSYETDTHYCVSVEDDGVGFDTNALLDDRKHVGLRNIRERLKVMVNGVLEINSTPGAGTKVVIKIPKETEK